MPVCVRAREKSNHTRVLSTEDSSPSYIKAYVKDPAGAFHVHIHALPHQLFPLIIISLALDICTRLLQGNPRVVVKLRIFFIFFRFFRKRCQVKF